MLLPLTDFQSTFALPETASFKPSTLLLPDHFWLCVLITWAKAAFTRNNMHCLDSEPTPAFENMLQHSANALYFLIISTCLGNCSQLSTHWQYLEPHFSGFDILNLTPRPQKTAETRWQLIITFQRKRNITLYCKQKIHCSFENYGEYTDAPANTTCFFIN